MRRGLLLVVAIASVCLAFVLGWLVPGKGRLTVTGIDLVALATFALAGVTVYLAVQTRNAVRAAREEASVAREGLALGRAQAETARESFDSQTRPFLTVGSIQTAVLNSGSVHVRNVGNATAIVSRAQFL